MDLWGGEREPHHSLSDFRNEATDLLNGLLTQSVMILLSEGLVEIRRVAQDGMKVRASAGASSFRTRAGLAKLQKVAREQVETLAKEIEADPGSANRREEAARKKAAEDREKRIERAIEQMAEAERRKRSNNGKKKNEARTSTTDPSARVMKMADGGFRPAYNIHFVSETVSKVVIAVDVENVGTDKHAMVPLAEQSRKTLRRPSPRVAGRWRMQLAREHRSDGQARLQDLRSAAATPLAGAKTDRGETNR
jgi:flagellar biosynthesis GTPase FlhF